MKLLIENFRKFTENYEEHERQRIAYLQGDIPLWSSFGGEVLPIKNLMYTGQELDGNYTEEELAGWLEKYELTHESPATWVTTNPLYAAGYKNEMRPPEVDRYIEEKGEDAFREEFAVEFEDPTFTKQDGILVIESHDGDDGYIFIPFRTSK